MAEGAPRLQWLRARHDATPVLILTARDQPGDKVRGPGEMKNGIFVPARLMIGEFPQGRMGRRRPQ